VIATNATNSLLGASQVAMVSTPGEVSVFGMIILLIGTENAPVPQGLHRKARVLDL
jgi:hypothetical protein